MDIFPIYISILTETMPLRGACGAVDSIGPSGGLDPSSNLGMLAFFFVFFLVSIHIFWRGGLAICFHIKGSAMNGMMYKSTRGGESNLSFEKGMVFMSLFC